ncbi:hypothetical protein EON65_48415 [archaeon]|nr:MAG: hypothetical protein EON65_48415 [archaeon]
MQKQIILLFFSLVAIFGVTFVFHYFYSDINELYDSYSLTSADEFWQHHHLKLTFNISHSIHTSIFPNLVHQTWKSHSLPPAETLKWRSQCMSLNLMHTFHMYDDDHLQAFVHTYYPEYSSMFDALSGVYMADMARMLLVYHYGGAYMDLDFLCHKPLYCLERHVKHHIQSLLHEEIKQNSHVLVLSREPVSHAIMLHHRQRTVIQDFFLATPKHPTLKFILDMHNWLFQTNPMQFLKEKPFSYSIEKELDKYYAKVEVGVGEDRDRSRRINDRNMSSLFAHNLSTANQSSSSATTSAPTPVYIYELPSYLLHPLLDGTNGKLHEGCKAYLRREGRAGGEVRGNHSVPSIDDELSRQCIHVYKKDYLVSGADNGNNINHGNNRDSAAALRGYEASIMVHMWTHTFLGWSSLRGLYKWGEYREVEKRLLPTFTCE